MKKPLLIVTTYRLFTAKPAWRINYDTVIGDLESVLKHILISEDFKNGLDWLKEIEGGKLYKVPKKKVMEMLSKSPEGEALFKNYNERF